MHIGLDKCVERKKLYYISKYAKTLSGLYICEAPHKFAWSVYTLVERSTEKCKVNSSYLVHFALHYTPQIFQEIALHIVTYLLILGLNGSASMWWVQTKIFSTFFF